jgi:hypothetical protein
MYPLSGYTLTQPHPQDDSSEPTMAASGIHIRRINVSQKKTWYSSCTLLQKGFVKPIKESCYKEFLEHENCIENGLDEDFIKIIYHRHITDKVRFIEKGCVITEVFPFGYKTDKEYPF